MIMDRSYHKSFIAAACIHLALLIMLLLDPSTQRPVMTADSKNEANQELVKNQATPQNEEIVKAVSVDSKEVAQTVERIKLERANQIKQEQQHQQQLVKQAETARQARLQEQRHLARLKEEADKLAIARKKQIEEEQQRIKQLALQKEQETKRLAELKAKQQLLEKKQEAEAKKLAQIKKTQQEEKLKADIQLKQAKKSQLEAEKAHQAQLQREREAKAEAELTAKRQAAAQQAALDNAKKSRMAGEVDKYKAMIVNAISTRWILPENVDRGLSSQFRIRLAPNGAVLEVSLIRSSGDPILDRSAQTAIYKASPLPVPHDPDLFDVFRDISLTVRPETARG